MLIAALICSAAATALAQTVRPHTIEQLVSGFGLFDEPLVWVGAAPPPAAESQALWGALLKGQAGPWPDSLSALEDFISTYPDSIWVPSLRALLGKAYRECGRDTLALAHWEAAWDATSGFDKGAGKHVADYALAHWTRLLASLGRYETLTALITLNSTRVLDRGPLSQRWARTCEAAAEMRQYPGVSYKCGTYALDAVGRALHRAYNRSALLGIPSPATGFSMDVLATLSSQLQLGLVGVVRPVGGPLVVPSVVHWRQNHYAAIVEQRGRFYCVVDPTFEQPRWMTFDTIDSEASGAFLVPQTSVPAGYAYLSPADMKQIFGRGNPNFLGDNDDRHCSCDEGSCSPGMDGMNGSISPGLYGPIEGMGNSGSCGSCGGVTVGMPSWRVSEPYVNLWLEDEPLPYVSATGPAVPFRISFKQRQDLQYGRDFSSFGNNWYCSWLSVVDSSWYATYHEFHNNYLYFQGGGQANYISADAVATNYNSTLKLWAVTNASGDAIRYELIYPTGAKDLYEFAPTNATGGRPQAFYLTAKISPAGRTTSFYYDDYDPAAISVRLRYIVDADGHTNAFSYTNSAQTQLVTGVSDSFGRSVYFTYDSTGLLTNIVDAIGLSTSAIYDEYGWVTNLTTPYGTNAFVYTQRSVSGYVVDRSVTITEANGSKQLYTFAENPTWEVSSYPTWEVPTNTPIGTLDNTIAARNTYHWGRQQYALLSTNYVDSFTPADYLLARMRHWLGSTTHYGDTRQIDTLSVERDFSSDGSTNAQITWYDYPDKPATDVQGSCVLPSVAARVLPDGSTWYNYLQRNQWGWTTNAVSTWTQPDGTIGTRTNIYVYASNGVDLVLQIGPQAEQVVSNYFGNSYHQPDASYDALNQQTTYTYNANRQVTSITSPAGLTTTNIYFGSGTDAGRLSQTIDLQINRTNSYTYYGNGLVLTHTDERGLLTTNYWDNLQRLTGVGYPDGGTTNIYSRLDLVGTRDKLGYWTRFAYDGIRRKYAETNANNAVTWITYCECGSPSTITRAYGTAISEQTTFTYDYQGNRLISAAADGYNVTNWYNPLHQVVSTGDGAANKWMFYNNQGLLTVVSNAYGAVQNKVWDVEDRPVYVTDQNNVTVTNTYDLLGGSKRAGIRTVEWKSSGIRPRDSPPIPISSGSRISSPMTQRGERPPRPTQTGRSSATRIIPPAICCR